MPGLEEERSNALQGIIGQSGIHGTTKNRGSENPDSPLLRCDPWDTERVLVMTQKPSFIPKHNLYGI
ncbi:unnamed protein product [Victoria cruziana]